MAHIRPNRPQDPLLTTHEAAAHLGVGPSSIKRWADDGTLRCVRTAGGHRRFPRSAVLALQAPAALGDRWLRGWLEDLRADEPARIARRLREDHARAGRWARVADRLGAVLAAIGDGWWRGELSVVEEHVMSERLSRGLARAADTIAIAPAAPVALLLTADGEDHTLGLSLLELALRELGWRTRWCGRRTPLFHLAAGLPDDVALIAVSASSAQSDQLGLRAQADALAALCASRAIQLVLGGAAPWPDPPPYGAVVRSFTALPSPG